MKIRFLNKVSANRKFDYTPMYYNEQRERLHKKAAMIRKESEGSLSNTEKRELMRERMRQNWEQGEYRKSQNKKSNIRILILVSILLLLGYFLFNGIDQVDSIVTKLK